MLPAFFSTLLDTLLPQSSLEHAVSKLTTETLSAHLHLAKYENILVLFSYRNLLIRKMIWMIKYKGNKDVTRVCANVLHEVLLEEMAENLILNPLELVVIPIPLSKERLRERGFNQAALLSKALSEIDPNLWKHESNALIKVRETPAQTTLPRAKRLTNVTDAFSVINPHHVRCKDIVLIDDVTTTGSTLKEAAQELEKAGARRIIPVALAH